MAVVKHPFSPLLYVQCAPLKHITLPISFSFWEGFLHTFLLGLSSGRFTYRLCTFGEKCCLGLDLRNVELVKCGQFPACNCIIL